MVAFPYFETSSMASLMSFACALSPSISTAILNLESFIIFFVFKFGANNPFVKQFSPPRPSGYIYLILCRMVLTGCWEPTVGVANFRNCLKINVNAVSHMVSVSYTHLRAHETDSYLV